MKHTIIIGLMSLTLFAQAQTSENNPKLKDALERFPKADANGDGVLSLEEAKAFKEKADKDGGGNGIRSSSHAEFRIMLSGVFAGVRPVSVAKELDSPRTAADTLPLK